MHIVRINSGVTLAYEENQLYGVMVKIDQPNYFLSASIYTYLPVHSVVMERLTFATHQGGRNAATPASIEHYASVNRKTVEGVPVFSFDVTVILSKHKTPMGFSVCLPTTLPPCNCCSCPQCLTAFYQHH
jgi:hypothetical protein